MKRSAPINQLFKRMSALERAGMSTRSQAKKPATRKKRTRKASGGTLRTIKMGEVSEIIYRDLAGVMRKHTCRPRGRLSYTPDGKLLVIDGVRVAPFIDSK